MREIEAQRRRPSRRASVGGEWRLGSAQRESCETGACRCRPCEEGCGACCLRQGRGGSSSGWPRPRFYGGCSSEAHGRLRSREAHGCTAARGRAPAAPGSRCVLWRTAVWHGAGAQPRCRVVSGPSSDAWSAEGDRRGEKAGGRRGAGRGAGGGQGGGPGGGQAGGRAGLEHERTCGRACAWDRPGGPVQAA